VAQQQTIDRVSEHLATVESTGTPHKRILKITTTARYGTTMRGKGRGEDRFISQNHF